MCCVWLFVQIFSVASFQVLQFCNLSFIIRAMNVASPSLVVLPRRALDSRLTIYSLPTYCLLRTTQCYLLHLDISIMVYFDFHVFNISILVQVFWILKCFCFSMQTVVLLFKFCVLSQGKVLIETKRTLPNTFANKSSFEQSLPNK